MFTLDPYDSTQELSSLDFVFYPVCHPGLTSVRMFRGGNMESTETEDNPYRLPALHGWLQRPPVSPGCPSFTLSIRAHAHTHLYRRTQGPDRL